MALFYSVNVLRRLEEKGELWDGIRRLSAEESGITPEESWQRMRYALQVMQEADRGYDGSARSHSGLSGGDGEKMARYACSGGSICGEFIGEVLAGALRMGECNACMHRIVAAPTAGSCGVLPAVLLPYGKKFHSGEEMLIRALYIAAGYGAVIAERASLSGAEAGCQAEIGTASAMAAAALVYLRGGNAAEMENALSFALKNMMGLVCDPVAGLVEVPCVKRNAAGAMNALTAAEMALAGIVSRIPIDAMAAVGAQLSPDLKETGRGGVAASPSARRFRKSFFEK